MPKQKRSVQLRTSAANDNSKQNRSDAVMAQRGAADDELDDFPTPPWATRAFVTKVIRPEPGETAVEPAAGRGYMSEVLKEVFERVDSYDIGEYNGYCPALPGGFLENPLFDKPDQWDWCITNPPFKLAQQFVERGLHVARRGVAMLCRTVIIEGMARYENLYSPLPPALVAQYVERVPMVEGGFDPKASTATGYAWIVWDKLAPAFEGYANGLVQAPLCWIPPCRKELERPYERINALLIVAKNEHDKAVREHAVAEDIRLGTLDGTAADQKAAEERSAEHEEKSIDRGVSARRELAALRAGDDWKAVRPLLRDVDGARLTDKRIAELTKAA